MTLKRTTCRRSGRRTTKQNRIRKVRVGTVKKSIEVICPTGLCRNVLPVCVSDYRFLIHDRDRIYSQELDVAVRAMGVKVLKTPFRSPQANSHGERLIGSLGRDCLDFLIPIHERHLRRILKDWKTHSGQAGPRASLGPGLPEPEDGLPVPLPKQRHQIPQGYRVSAKPILGGLHHEYRLEKIAA